MCKFGCAISRASWLVHVWLCDKAGDSIGRTLCNAFGKNQPAAQKTSQIQFHLRWFGLQQRSLAICGFHRNDCPACGFVLLLGVPLSCGFESKDNQKSLYDSLFFGGEGSPPKKKHTHTHTQIEGPRHVEIVFHGCTFCSRHLVDLCAGPKGAFKPGESTICSRELDGPAPSGSFKNEGKLLSCGESIKDDSDESDEPCRIAISKLSA